MAPILSYPFRFSLDGRAAVVDQASDEANTQQIAVLCLTRTGERALRPGFGLADPTFDGFSASELAAKLALYGPPVSLNDVEVDPQSDQLQLVKIDFTTKAAA